MVAWLLDRLKTELADAGGEEMAGLAAGAGGDDAEKSNRSPRAAEAGWAAGLGIAADAVGELSPPKPPISKDCFGAGGEVGVGLASKKLPPLRLEKAELLDGGAGRPLEKLFKLAKASCFGLFGPAGEAKLKLLNASFIPPNDVWLCWLMPVAPDTCLLCAFVYAAAAIARSGRSV